MKTLTTALFFISFFFFQLSAQDIESWISSKKPLLFEKLYVHVDRELYVPGDKIWLKAYQVNGITHQLNSNFRNVYVQLISEEGKVVQDIYLLTIKGIADGEFITDNLSTGMYTIRAFTKYLENFGEAALFHKKIWIVNPAELQQSERAKAISEGKMDISFLPEGGNLVNNALNTIAFKAINGEGKGIYVSGYVMNDAGDTITSISASYKGMGKFNLMPEEGLNYFAGIDQFPGLKFPLPKAQTDGIGLICKPDEESLMFELSTNMKLETYPEFYFVASHKGIVLFYKKVEMTEYSQALKVNKHLFPTGISKIAVLDLQMNPLAERLIFIDENKRDQLQLQINQEIFEPRREVKIDVMGMLEPGDSITSGLSVAVVNRNYLSTGENSQNIKSYLLLDSDLKGAIESPAEYFVDDEFHSSAEKLDLLMLVHGWRTYFWDDIEKKQTPSLDDWNDAGIDISGWAKRMLWKEPLPGAEVSLDYVFKNFQIAKTTTNSAGRFSFDHVYFVDSLNIMLNARTKNGTKNVEILLDQIMKRDSIIPFHNLNMNTLNIDLNPNFASDNYYRRTKELEFFPEKGTILLDEVEILEKKAKRAFSRSFGEYVWADRTFLIKPSDYSFQYVIDYLRYNLPSLVVSGDSIMIGNKGVTFMLDGVAIEEFELRTIRMQEIELIDFLHPGFRRGFSAGLLGVVDETGLIAIYQKTPFKPVIDYNFSKGRLRPELKGFHRPAKFYSPKYTLENVGSPRPDFRPTLYWNPDVRIENGNAPLEFFTSDELSEYVVYLEGISKNGRICFGTASFSVNKK
ncbi:MAG: hypothetical protein Q8K69_11340 [Bacteroidota bacterium]|nr:hypothetical protein [Bacteroidota bacterium]MDP3435558.1 hypothetical protein [Bacteroidota bacterium]